MHLKKILLTFTLFIAFALSGVCEEITVSDSVVKNMIAKYKAQNYTGCIQASENIIEADPSNIYAYYYQALSYSQLGDKNKATDAFNQVETLNSNAVLVNYAKKGKACLISVESCEQYDNSIDGLESFINSGKFLDKSVQHDMNVKKLNRTKDIINKEMKEIKPEKKSEMPSNDEIAEAVKTLAKVGFNPFNNSGMPNMYQTPEMIQAGMLLGNNDSNNMNNMLPYFLMSQSQNGSNKISPELIQTMMMSQMQMY